MKSSRVHGFSGFSIDERIEYVRNFAGLIHDEEKLLYDSFNLVTKERADKLIENCVCGNPLTGIITNARINEKDYLIPVSIEESSIIAAAPRAFKLARENGIEAKSSGNYMTGMLQITKLVDPVKAKSILTENEAQILKSVNEGHSHIKAEYLEFEEFEKDLLLYLVVNTGDAQGANTINKMCESISEYVEDITNSEIVARIISNYADKHITRSKIKIKKNDLSRVGFSSDEVLERFLKVSKLGEMENIHRAATNNKGIMNGVISVANATGQDTRAIYTASETYAIKNGKYSSLSKWYEEEEYLVGELEMPMPVGIVGGATEHPYYKLGLKILGVESAREFQEVLVSVGLANNFCAIQEIATQGITKRSYEPSQKKI